MEDPVLFQCSGRAFTSRHLVAAAQLWQGLEGPRLRIRRALAGAAWAQRVGLAIDDAVVQEASERFRRDRGLRSAKATQAWLDAHAVGIDDLADFLERQALADMHAQNEAGHPATVDEATVEALLWPELVFSGELPGLCRQLARQAAVAAEAQALSAEPGEDLALLVRALDARFAAFAKEAAPPARIETALRVHWGDFLRIACECASFADQDTAREARLCVCEDGAELAHVATSAGGTHWAGTVLLCQLPDGVRDAIQAAGEGEALPVISSEGQHALWYVRAKQRPSLDDAETHARLREAVLDEATAPLVAAHITWGAVGL